MYTYRLRRDVSQNWSHKNPILDSGEPGFEEDTGKLKIGDGYSTWLELKAFYPSTSGGTGGEVISDEALLAHINSLTPHPVYDDGPSFLLLYQNAKV